MEFNNDVEDNQAVSVNPYILVPMGWDKEGRGHLGSFYTLLTETLCSTRQDWKRIATGKLKKGLGSFGRYHLLLAEAQGRGLHYGKLSSFASTYPGMRVLTNYYRGFQCICRKAMMVQTLRDYFENTLKMPDRAKWFIPETFALYPAKRSECEREALYARLQGLDDSGGEAAENNYWILKPSDGLKGNRIVVLKGVDAVRDHVESLSGDSVAWVASRYLHKPALVRGNRKFDVRCWVLLDKDYNAYMYKEGVLRTAASAYTLDDLSDIFTHLSNHCIAVKHSDFGKYEPTNELWFPQYDEYLLETTGGAVGFYRDVIPKIKNVIAHTLEAGRATMCPDLSAQNFDAFELFGFDIALTDDYEAYLLEVNSSPAVAEHLMPCMCRDVLDLVVDKTFAPQISQDRDESATPNGFERIFATDFAA